MNIFLLAPELVVSSRCVLDGQQHKHIQKVLKASSGDSVKIGVINGNLGLASVVETGASHTTIEIQTLDNGPPKALPVTLLLALPRPKALKRILRSATEMGIKEIVLLNTWRVDKSYWLSPMLKDSVIRQCLLDGLEQARDTVLPAITLAKRFKPFIEDQLPNLSNGKNCILAHPGPYEGFTPNTPQPTMLAIGPEGGFIPYEVERLIEAGFQPRSLGPRILRTETAVPALISRLF